MATYKTVSMLSGAMAVKFVDSNGQVVIMFHSSADKQTTFIEFASADEVTQFVNTITSQS